MGSGIRTTIRELGAIIKEYKEALCRMKIYEVTDYPIILNITNKTGKIDDWVFDDDRDDE